jgi:tRNA (guanine37-N1)-methyltransferase
MLRGRKFYKKTMRIDIITVLPEIFKGPFDQSILKRAQSKGVAELHVHNLRDFAFDKHKNVDDYAFGGGAGMVMMVEPIHKCIEKLKSERQYDEVIYMSPDGELFDQKMANQLSLKGNLIILCGHYKGVDERVRMHLITREISIGDYVLSGGELAAAVVTDAIIRLLPGVLNDETSALTDSFQDDLIAPPVFTRPEIYNDWKVPEILMSGHERKINEWRYEKSVDRTKQRRPNLLP